MSRTALWTTLALVVGPSLLSRSVSAAAYYNNSQEYQSGALGASPTQSFRSVNFSTVALNYNVLPSSFSSSNDSYLFLAPRGTDVSDPTALILTPDGEVVWFGAAEEFGYAQSMAFQTGYYKGQQVITIWDGRFNAAGYGNGFGIILDQSYSLIANLSSNIEGSTLDFHEFYLTDNDTALATVYINQQYDLSSYNVTTTDGSQGWILGGAFEEIEVATGQSLFTWKSLDHVEPSQCYAEPGSTGTDTTNPYDYFHINSIEKDLQGNYLISSRHCHALYYISAQTGAILWTIGGKNSSFSMGDGSAFEWQHDARWRDNYTQISVFDNAATSWESDESYARGLLLNVDTSANSVTLAQAFIPWNQTVSKSQGSMQQLSNGNWLLGWGQTPFFSEYDLSGTLLSSAQFGVGNVQGYRVLSSNWTGYPTTTPALAVVNNASTSQYDIYVSWNGATEVDQWVLTASSNPSSSSATTTTLNQVQKTTFETLISIDQDVAASYSWVQSKAVSSNGSILGFSDWVALNGSTASVPADEAQSSQVTVGTASATSTSQPSSAVSTSSGGSSAASKEVAAEVATVLLLVAGGLVALL
ncbi:hypothetical protein I317_01461 [Kwoniella heveanensis CBS 569]|nr:hypothetical protein I317_01461 [Kwoniella heveanensis CBS 569]